MTEFLADTFYWLAILNPDDAHADIVAGATFDGDLILTDAIRLEVMDALSDRRNRPRPSNSGRRRSTSEHIIVIPTTEPLLARAAELFRRRPDKDWSFTDCLSFVVMADRGIRTALTGDHHFEQAGFGIAFKS